MLLLVNNPRTSCALIDFVNTLKKGGLYVLGHVEVGKLEELDYDPSARLHSGWLSLVDHLKIKAFIELTVAQTIRDGIQQLVRISGKII
jgi:potassium/chloride transporter 9